MTIDPPLYTTVFDLTRDNSRHWAGSAFGLLAMAVGLGFVLYELRWRSVANKSRRLLAWLGFSFACLWTAAISFGTYSEYSTLARAVRTGQAEYVEGPVENFVPMPVGGHGVESFEVAGKRFEYSDFTLTAGFNNTASHGGPIRPGRIVRVRYVGGTIVHLAVAP